MSEYNKKITECLLNILASNSADYHLVKCLIKQGADVNASSEIFQNGPVLSAIERAIEWRHCEIVELLLENGAKEGKEHSLLYHAFKTLSLCGYRGDRDTCRQIIELLCEHGFKTRPEENEFFIITSGDFDANIITGGLIDEELIGVTNFMIKAGALDLNATDVKGKTVLDYYQRNQRKWREYGSEECFSGILYETLKARKNAVKKVGHQMPKVQKQIKKEKRTKQIA